MKYLLILLLGALLGAGAAVFFLGPPRARSAPGVKVAAPDPKGDPPGTVVVSLDQGFVDAVLSTTFSGLGTPTFNLGKLQGGMEQFEQANFQAGCTNSITLLPEGSGVKTGVQFANGKISAPMAFTGSYNLVGNCMQFKGWAQTSVELRFEEPKQTVYGTVTVDGVNLEGVSPVANNFITVFVQGAINQKVNPLVLVNERQLSLMVPIKASNGSVKARAKDVKAEILNGSLKFHVSYEFAGVKGEV
ncbi:MAG TPA: hypothetical protein VGP85_24790 [Pyrinomonadaceae bacterium]|jgi:hypothetical protein|nr:hypothetical protein [Pyrinomonadaceae bacterium]